MKAELGEAVLEINPDTKVPSLRFLNVTLKDDRGEVIARAPKVAIALDSKSIWSGEFVVRSVELIGPTLRAKRSLDGSVTLGFSTSVTAIQEEQITFDDSVNSSPESGKTDLEGGSEILAETVKSLSGISGRQLVELFARQDDTNPLSAILEVKITRAALSIYDEANDARWEAPRADFAFKKMPYGFAIAAKVEIASGGDPWTAELSANYQLEQRVFSVSSTIANLVPANLSDEIFALSDFARVKVPLSGQIDFEINDEGKLSKATGEFQAAAGEISLPEYISRPIIIDEGTVRAELDPLTSNLQIVDSNLYVGGSQIALRGNIMPEHNEDGRLSAITINLKAENAKVDTQGQVRNALQLDSVIFEARALVDQRSLVVNKLALRSAETGLTLNGTFTAGRESVGIDVEGRIVNMSSELLKSIWPPKIAAKSKQWIEDNIIKGQINSGTFKVNFAPNGLAKALKDKAITSESLKMDFVMTEVYSRYFKTLPVLQNADGVVELRGDNINLKIQEGQATLDSGEVVKLVSGSFVAKDMMREPALGVFNFDVTGSIKALNEFGLHPDLNLSTMEADKIPEMSGKANVKLALSVPLVKNAPKEQVKLELDVKLSDTRVKNVIAGVELAEGEFVLQLVGNKTIVSGPASLNGFPSKVVWQKERGMDPTAEIETTLDEKTRERLGLKLSDYISGPTPVKIQVTDIGKSPVINIEADLSKVDMRVKAMGWSRSKAAGTNATFRVRLNEKGRRVIENLKIKGKNFGLSGDVELGEGNVLRVLNLSSITLDGENYFAARLEPQGDINDLTVTGKNFDATPYIKSMISPSKPSSEVSGTKQGGLKFNVNARFERVYANRGEVLQNVNATMSSRGGVITSANIEGSFLSGLPLKIRLTPVENGRELVVNTNDGGAALRAANFYSKVAGGQLQFSALITNGAGSPIRNGTLDLQRFEVRSEAALAELDARGKPKKSGPRRGGVYFKRLVMPFTTEANLVRLCKVSLRGNEMGATASGLIRKSDGALDVTGTYIPAYGLNNFLGEIPLLGDLLVGGKREGVFAVTYAMGGTISKPKFNINPISFLAPGILRKIFDYEQNACRTNVTRPKATAQSNVQESGDSQY